MTEPVPYSGISTASNKTYITEDSSLVLETLEDGRHHHYLIPSQVASSFPHITAGIIIITLYQTIICTFAGIITLNIKGIIIISSYHHRYHNRYLIPPLV